MNRPFLFSLSLLTCLSGPAQAEPSTRTAWTPEVLSIVKHGDADRGKTLAQNCAVCHGQTTPDSAFPILNGQLATYLFRQLQDYKDGSRPNDIMSGLAAGLSTQDMADIAAWYSRQPPPGWRAPGTDGLQRGFKLVRDGDPKRMIPTCAVCHGAEGQGEVVDTPRLAGQSRAYLESTLKAYRSGDRHNDIYQRMRFITQQLSAEEIGELARYYSGSTP